MPTAALCSLWLKVQDFVCKFRMSVMLQTSYQSGVSILSLVKLLVVIMSTYLHKVSFGISGSDQQIVSTQRPYERMSKLQSRLYGGAVGM